MMPLRNERSSDIHARRHDWRRLVDYYQISQVLPPGLIVSHTVEQAQ